MTAVTESALRRRINRILAKEYQRLCKSRPGGEKRNLGDWHVIDAYRNTVILFRVDLEEFGRGVGALGSQECLAMAAYK